jgi:zinc transporter ZupT
MTPFWAPFLASILAAVITGAGIYTVRRHGAWAHENGAYILCFAAGVLITISFLHLVPESFELAAHAPLYLLAGYLLLFFLNRFLDAYASHGEPDASRRVRIGIIPVIGIGCHSLVDGIIYPITFTVSLFTGITAAVGMVLHEFPEGVISYVLLTSGGFSERKSLLFAVAAASLTTPVGTLISYPFISKVGQPLLGSLLSLSAGALLYVGASHLLPEALREKRRYSTVALFCGVAAAVIMVLLKHE